METDLAAVKLRQALALHDRGELAQAEVLYREILHLQPKNVDALHCLGLVQGASGHPQAALELISQAIAQRPDSSIAYSNRGLALLELGRPAEALVDLERSVALDPALAQAWIRRGVALERLNRFAEAVASYEQGLAIRPDDAETLCNRGNALVALQRYDEALASYARARVLKPEYPWLFGAWLFTKMRLCAWEGLDAAFAELTAGVAAGRSIARPFFTLATPMPGLLRRQCAEIATRPEWTLGHRVQEPVRRTSHDRIRLGYFSGDFREQVVAYLTAGLFEKHDRSRFHLTAFSFGSPPEGTIRSRIKAAFDQFMDLEDRSDADIASLARALEIDIAIDLTGFTEPARTGVFARRTAPIQVNYLGYAGTMGAPFYDYLIADPTVIPSEHFSYYTEKIVWLPHTYLVNDSGRAVAGRPFTRQEMGLPEQGFVFCNFSPSFKIGPRDFDIWMRLLKAVDGSVLWLSSANSTAEKDLRDEAASRQVAPDRLVFKQHAAMHTDHLAQIRLADLFLDTYYFNAHTTANDALWAGLPVLTELGETFAGRVAASLLRAVGLPELVTGSPQAYEALALDLATDPSRLVALRRRLAANILTEPLFDTALFTRHIEAAYAAIWQRHQAGLPPDNLAVRP